MDRPTRTSRRTLLAAALGGAAATGLTGRLATAALAYVPGAILKPLPPAWFTDRGTNAEMRWDSVETSQYLTSPARLFVRNHTSTPVIDSTTWSLRLYGDGLARARTEADALELTLDDLRRLPTRSATTVLECTGNGRGFFDSQQGTPAAGTPWGLGAVGTVRWEGVRLGDLLRHVGLADTAVCVQGTGLDPSYVSGGTDFGHVRRPLPIAKALDDTLLAWGMNGGPLLPDHGYPLRLVVPGWVGIASTKWLGSLEVASSELTSPWSTTWYRMTGGDFPPDSPPLTVNPVRSAWELAWGAEVPARRRTVLAGRSWSGAGPVVRVDVSVDGGATWQRASLLRPGRRDGWTQWSFTWVRPEPGAHELMARATDVAGRTQPLVARPNDGGYFFDAVVRHPVRVV